MEKVTYTQSRKGNTNIYIDGIYLCTLVFTTRDMSLRESRRIFEGDDNGHSLWIHYKRGKDTFCSSHCTHIMDGYGNGYGPSDLEEALKILIRKIQIPGFIIPKKFQTWDSVFRNLDYAYLEMKTARQKARQSSNAIVYGYEGT